MADEGGPQGPPRFPPVDEREGALGPWPAPDAQPPVSGYAPGGGYGWPGYGQPGGRPPHWLHPLDVGRTFGTAFRLYRTYWRKLLGTAFVLGLPATIILGFVQGYMVGPSLQQWQDAYLREVALGRVPQLAIPVGALVGTLAVTLVVSAVMLITVAALVAVVDGAYRGRVPGVLDALDLAVSRALSVLGAAVLAALGVGAVAVVGAILVVALVVGLAVVDRAFALASLGAFAAAVAMIVAVTYITLRWFFFVQVVMCERSGAVDALRRSWLITKGSLWRILGYTILASLIYLAVSLIAGVIFGIVAIPAMMAQLRSGGFGSPVVFPPELMLLNIVLGGIAGLLVAPYQMAIQTLLYYDVRWRRGEEIPDQSAASRPSPAEPAPAL